MRRTPFAPVPLLLALGLAVVAAGCLGAGESTTPTPPPTTEPPVATPEAEPETPADPEPEAAPEPEAQPEPPVEVYRATFDFAEGDATGQSPKSESTRAVPEGHATVLVNITLTRGASTPTPLPVTGAVNSPTVRILDAAGAEVVAVVEEGTRSVSVPATPGAWTVRYEGAGTLSATVVMTAFP